MFDDAKYMAKEAVERNDALAALDQQRSEDKVYTWSTNRGIRRAIGTLLGLATVAIPVITGLNEPRVFVLYVLAWVAILALARTAMRAASPSPIGRTEFLVLAGLSAFSAVVAISAQTDVNLQAGVTATAGVILAVAAAATAASSITRCWR
jgi:hypothetical protein